MFSPVTLTFTGWSWHTNLTIINIWRCACRLRINEVKAPTQTHRQTDGQTNVTGRILGWLKMFSTVDRSIGITSSRQTDHVTAARKSIQNCSTRLNDLLTDWYIQLPSLSRMTTREQEQKKKNRAPAHEQGLHSQSACWVLTRAKIYVQNYSRRSRRWITAKKFIRLRCSYCCASLVHVDN